MDRTLCDRRLWGKFSRMWCKHCRQDVPGIASESDARPRCARCSRAAGDIDVAAAPAHRTGTATDGIHGAEDLVAAAIALATDPPPPAIDLDDWVFDEDLELVRRLASKRKDPFSPEPNKLPPAMNILHPATARPRPRTAGSPRNSWVAWTLLALGMMAFAFGAVLLGWSLLAERQELWSLGLPIALAGQFPLLLGLILLLDGLWQNHRQTTDQLDWVDERLVGLDHSAGPISGHVPAPSFYSHLAAGASPQLLLADVKSQLDLLAVRMTRE